VHLDSSDDVVILHGNAYLQTPDHSLAAQLAKASTEKYGYGSSPDDYEKTGVYVFRPRLAFAWEQFPKDVTRSQFPDKSSSPE
jgi:hypothetical protein